MPFITAVLPSSSFIQRSFLSLCLAGSIWMPVHAWAAESYGIAMHGDLKYPKTFTHFEYVNPSAPKGGALRLSEMGTFDSLNPFILKGTSAAGIGGLLYEPLMIQADDEPFSMYGYIAETIDVSDDRKTFTFRLNPLAKWQDGTPIIATDVKWTFDTLMTKGHPFFKSYYGDIEKVHIIDDRTVRFSSKNPDNRELPLVIAQMQILPAHDFDDVKKPFDGSGMTIPMGSGPYKISTIKPGSQITYTRAENWWAKDLPLAKGRYNFDTITYDYYKDNDIALEAFFGGLYDVRSETIARLWSSGYNVKPVLNGDIIKAEIPHAQPTGMQGFIFNLRRPVFQDIRVRQAITLAFDYEWSNKQLASGAYVRTDSFFENSTLGASGLPSAAETALLKQLQEQFGTKNVPDDVFMAYTPPVTDGSGNNRANLRAAAALLDQAGYKVGKNGIRTNDKGEPLTFEYIDANPAFERWINPFIKNLKTIGISARLRTIDPTQYQNRMQNFDFDMTTSVFPQSDSPGNEQRDFWSSKMAATPGSRNLTGIQNPAVDAVTEMIIQAKTREELTTRTRVLDRILLRGHIAIPGWHFPKWRVAWRKGLQHPSTEVTKSLGVLDTWWWDKP